MRDDPIMFLVMGWKEIKRERFMVETPFSFQSGWREHQLKLTISLFISLFPTAKMRISNILSRYSDLKEANIQTLTSQHSYKVSQFHKLLKNSYGKSLSKLQVLQSHAKFGWF
jgi:hypothetical protein